MFEPKYPRWYVMDSKGDPYLPGHEYPHRARAQKVIKDQIYPHEGPHRITRVDVRGADDVDVTEEVMEEGGNPLPPSDLDDDGQEPILVVAQ
jgi:hypothetical protein